jgi:hypothetical protein
MEVVYMASIEKRGLKSYRLEIDLGYDANGRIRERRTIRVPDDILKRANVNSKPISTMNWLGFVAKSRPVGISNLTR